MEKSSKNKKSEIRKISFMKSARRFFQYVIE